MIIRNVRVLAPCVLLLAAFAHPARAQWAVVDAPAIAQLIQQAQTMQEQLATARAQLQSAEQGYRAITGDRGMGLLLGNTTRNYLPSSWPQVTNLLERNDSRAFPNLSGQVQAAVSSNAILSPADLAALSPADQLQIQNTRQWIAVRQALAQATLANASGRFASLQTLISAISTAADQKATLDLQARISVELAMLQNEQIKLQALREATFAQQDLLQQQARERAIESQGRFEMRFHPAP